jgi:photosystem II stability/assembly factor-like uncharacterized protein
MKYFFTLLLISVPFFHFSQELKWEQIIYSNPESTFKELCTKIESYFKEHEFEKIEVEKAEKEKEGSSYNKYLRWKYFNQFRLTEDGRLPSSKTILNGFSDEKAKQKLVKSTNCTWNYIDQLDNDGGYWGMGRVTGITIHPTDSLTYFVTTPGGGIWKTIDGGQNYTSLDDGLPYGSTRNLLIDPTNTNVMYVCNGESEGWFNSSTGIYKSTDGGATWLPTTFAFSLNAVIFQVKMNPTNTSILYAATTNGLYRTIDGGLNWNVIRPGSYSDIEFKPDNSSVIYIANQDFWGVSQVYKSIDAGNTWNQITNYTWNYNFIKLAVTPLDPERLLVSNDYGISRPLFESQDAGATYSQLTDQPEANIVGYSPNDVNILYCGYVVLYQSTDGGNTWNDIGINTGIHADFHVITHDPNTDKIYFGNDGGVYTYRESNQSWQELSNGLKIGQIYRISNAETNPSIMLCGTQDNGGRLRTNTGDWININGGDGMDCAIDPTNSQIFYTSYIRGIDISRTMDGGNSFNTIITEIPGSVVGEWLTPFELDPNNSQRILAGYNKLFQSYNRGNTWQEMTTNPFNSMQGFVDVEFAPDNDEKVFATCSNQITTTNDLGLTWQNVTLPGSQPITRIAVRPTNSNYIYASRGGYTDNLKVTMSKDGGATWINYSEGLPNVPCNVIIYEPNSPGRVYVGNDLGVYYRDSVMTQWEVYGQGLPFTFVNDIKIAHTANKLRIGTFGRGIWETDLCATTTASLTENALVNDYAYIYPNPAKNQFSIVQKTIHPIENIRLLDMNGKVQKIELQKEGEVTRITTSISSGVYQLTYSVNGKLMNQKIVIE